VTPRHLRLIFLAAAVGVALSGCGRRGPLELPPEVQARGDALKAQQEASRAKGPQNTAKPVPGQAQAEAPPPPIPGTIGHRPPDQYPFFLDPLLQ
jgi:predicted small lipoprotein YifL